MREEYTYAVAQIRAMEVNLFSKEIVDQLIACQTYEQCLQLLEEKGWGDGALQRDMEGILAKEEEKIWDVVRELGIPLERFDVLMYPKLFHNLKAAIKEVCTEETNQQIFYENGMVMGKEMLTLVRERRFEELPQVLQDVAREAYESLLHTRDGQLCDIMIDKAALEAICQAGKETKEPVIREYAKSYVEVANIKVAVRSAKTGKSLDFMEKAMTDCEGIRWERLAKAALTGIEGICEYLQETAYSQGAEVLRQSMSAFERWCDNRIIETMKSQKYEAFTLGPIVAYVIARQNEIRTVRMVLSGKQNQLPEESIWERIREMYV